MSDYIKRIYIEQRMYHEAFENDASYDPMAKWDSGLWIRYKLFENVLASIPSADVIEPKQGEWKEIDIKDYKAICSCCGTWTPIMGNYCPNCGARMKGADDEASD